MQRTFADDVDCIKQYGGTGLQVTGEGADNTTSGQKRSSVKVIDLSGKRIKDDEKKKEKADLEDESDSSSEDESLHIN